jgi:hypothetical protein
MSRPAGSLARGFTGAVTGAVLMAASLAHASADDDDLRLVLTRALYPVQLMAYCWREVDDADDFVATGRAWHERNFELLAILEDRGRDAAIDGDVRRQADIEALATMHKTVAGQHDGGAYCRTIMRIINGGYYDIGQRRDLEEPLKRIFGPQ